MMQQKKYVYYAYQHFIRIVIANSQQTKGSQKDSD